MCLTYRSHWCFGDSGAFRFILSAWAMIKSIQTRLINSSFLLEIYDNIYNQWLVLPFYSIPLFNSLPSFLPSLLNNSSVPFHTTSSLSPTTIRLPPGLQFTFAIFESMRNKMIQVTFVNCYGSKAVFILLSGNSFNSIQLTTLWFYHWGFHFIRLDSITSCGFFLPYKYAENWTN